MFFRGLDPSDREDGKVNVVLGKALSVLPKTELLKPVRNLLHRGPRQVSFAKPLSVRPEHNRDAAVAQTLRVPVPSSAVRIEPHPATKLNRASGFEPSFLGLAKA